MVRESVTDCLDVLKTDYNINLQRLHFTDIFCSNQEWSEPIINKDMIELCIFSGFVDIFNRFQIKSFIQTIEPYTFETTDPFENISEVYGINTNFTSNQACILCIHKIARDLKENENACIIIDQGIKEKGTIETYSFNNNQIQIQYKDSREEPLLQLADFFAFMVNRANAIQNEVSLSKTNQLFLSLYAKLKIKGKDFGECIIDYELPINEQSAKFHEKDRQKKELPSLKKK